MREILLVLLAWVAGPPEPPAHVSVSSTVIGPLRVSVGPLRAAPATDARPWLEHELVFTNTGGRILHFADTRTAAFIAPRRSLIAADQGCGYARQRPRGPVKADACLLYLDLMRLAPGQTARRTVTLWKGLPGMGALEPGRYVFERWVRFTSGRRRVAGTLELAYAIR